MQHSYKIFKFLAFVRWSINSESINRLLFDLSQTDYYIFDTPQVNAEALDGWSYNSSS